MHFSSATSVRKRAECELIFHSARARIKFLRRREWSRANRRIIRIGAQDPDQPRTLKCRHFVAAGRARPSARL
jgi:hypothetical protein